MCRRFAMSTISLCMHKKSAPSMGTETKAITKSQPNCRPLKQTVTYRRTLLCRPESTRKRRPELASSTNNSSSMPPMHTAVNRHRSWHFSEPEKSKVECSVWFCFQNGGDRNTLRPPSSPLPTGAETTKEGRCASRIGGTPGISGHRSSVLRAVYLPASGGSLQQTHNTEGGVGVQGRNHKLVFHVVYRDSPQVELCLHVLEPWLWAVLRKIRKLDRGHINHWRKSLSGQGG